MPFLSWDVAENVLLPYCDFSTLFQLRRCCKDFKRIVDRYRRIHKPVLRRVEAALNQVCPNFATKFKPALLASQGSVVSGGFLVHAILGNGVCDFDDVDIFVTNQGENWCPNPLFRYFMEHRLRPTRQQIRNMMSMNAEYDVPKSDMIHRITNYWCSRRLQVISYKDGLDPWQTILQKFDLDICVNKYDGKSVEIMYASQLANRQMTPRRIDAWPIRIKKYEKRGFQLVDPLRIVERAYALRIVFQNNTNNNQQQEEIE